MGSTAVVTNAIGEKEEGISYYPFGETRTDEGPVINLKHKYTGQELDSETGLYNYNARLYDPAVGRFLSADSIVPDPANPQSLNRYSYVRNNPLNMVDPTGHEQQYTLYSNSNYSNSNYSGDSRGEGTEIDLSELGHAFDGWGDKIGHAFDGWGDKIGHSLDGVGDKIGHSLDGVGDKISSFFGFGDDPPRPPSIASASNSNLPTYSFSNFSNTSSNNDSTKTWWHPGNYISLSHSTTFPFQFKGNTLASGINQETRSTDLFGESLDVQIGFLPSSQDLTAEISVGLGTHLGAGIFFGDKDYYGYKSGGLVLHFGYGLGLPLSISGTFPAE